MATICKSSNKRQISSKKVLTAPPVVTCEAWSIYDPIKRTFLAGKNENQQREVASISKIMTCIVCLEIAEEQEISLESIVSVPEEAAKMRGTSANLEEFDELTIYFGSFYMEDDPMQGFLRVMNYMAEYLELRYTSFQNPHGMSTKANFSSANDVNIMAAYALKNQVFKEIVGMKAAEVNIYNPLFGYRKKVWKNTNLLLGRGFDGAKTGTTDKAGPCLCATIDDPIKPFIVTILKSRNTDERWEDTIKLSNWIKTSIYSQFD